LRRYTLYTTTTPFTGPQIATHWELGNYL
jgi:hypothetical protein